MQRDWFIVIKICNNRCKQSFVFIWVISPEMFWVKFNWLLFQLDSWLHCKQYGLSQMNGLYITMTNVNPKWPTLSVSEIVNVAFFPEKIPRSHLVFFNRHTKTYHLKLGVPFNKLQVVNCSPLSQPKKK